MVLWFFDTPTVGSIIVFAIGIAVFVAYFRMLRWIQTTPPDAKSADEAPSRDGEK